MKAIWDLIRCVEEMVGIDRMEVWGGMKLWGKELIALVRRRLFCMRKLGSLKGKWMILLIRLIN